MLDPALQYDMVRPGIVLYGSCVPEMADELTWAQTLVTKPIRLQWIAPGDTVGYGRTFTAKRDTLVMTLPIGYGDGYPRILSNRACVLVHGQRAPLIGRVCMDMVMADVTDIPDVDLDDEVVLLGGQRDARITPDELAELAETIPYEIMLGFGARIPVEVVD
jgi:alanine racemase